MNNINIGLISNFHEVIPVINYIQSGLYIRAGSRRSSAASLSGFAGYFHCLMEESRHVEEMMFMRSKLLGLNTNKNLQCLSFLKTHRRLLTQGQFKNVMLENLVLKKSCCGGAKVGTI